MGPDGTAEGTIRSLSSSAAVREEAIAVRAGHLRLHANFCRSSVKPNEMLAVLALMTPAVTATSSAAEDASACESTLSSTSTLISLLAQRTRLMRDVAAHKRGDIIYDAAQELRVLEAAARWARGSEALIPAVPATVLAQLLADCAKQEQFAYLHDAAGLEACASGQASAEFKSHCLTSSYESLDEVRDALSALQRQVLELWGSVSAPQGEWDRAGCRCVRFHLKELFTSDFQSAARGGCASQHFSDMLSWTLLSASPTCRT